jgi:hypothetical protein
MPRVVSVYLPTWPTDRWRRKRGAPRPEVRSRTPGTGCLKCALARPAPDQFELTGNGSDGSAVTRHRVKD